MVYCFRRMAPSWDGLGGTSHSREGACVHLPSPQRCWLTLGSTDTTEVVTDCSTRSPEEHHFLPLLVRARFSSLPGPDVYRLPSDPPSGFRFVVHLVSHWEAA